MKIADLVNHKTLPSIIADDTGCITHVNDLFNKTYGWKKNQLIGSPLSSIIPKHLRDAHHMGFSRFLLRESPTILNQSMKLKVLHSDGKIADAIHYIIAEKVGKVWQFGATIELISDISDE